MLFYTFPGNILVLILINSIFSDIIIIAKYYKSYKY